MRGESGRCEDEMTTLSGVCRTVAKRVTSLQFSESAEHILAADRAGEVTRQVISSASPGPG